MKNVNAVLQRSRHCPVPRSTTAMTASVHHTAGDILASLKRRAPAPCGPGHIRGTPAGTTATTMRQGQDGGRRRGSGPGERCHRSEAEHGGQANGGADEVRRPTNQLIRASAQDEAVAEAKWKKARHIMG